MTKMLDNQQPSWAVTRIIHSLDQLHPSMLPYTSDLQGVPSFLHTDFPWPKIMQIDKAPSFCQ